MERSSDSNLTALTTEKKVLLEEMLSLTEQQTNVIKDEKFEDLGKLLDEKDLLIDKINDIDLKIKDIKPVEQKYNQELIKVYLQIDKVLGKMKILDDANNKEISQSMVTIKEELREVRQGRRALDNYSNSNPYHTFGAHGGTLFIDQDS